MIKYKQIEATDVVIATSGDLYINYNRIISSSSFPYPLDTARSKTYRDETSANIGRQLYALYIIDVDHLVSLINDVAGKTWLSTINL
jgi:diphthamide biosynthesis methyltransferase